MNKQNNVSEYFGIDLVAPIAPKIKRANGRGGMSCLVNSCNVGQ